MRVIEYFLFEADFVEENIRCIPMIVRLKLDAVGIKMALSTWSKCSTEERLKLAALPCDTAVEQQLYELLLETIILQYSGQLPVHIPIDENPLWKDEEHIPVMLQQQASIFGWTISPPKWKRLSILQRFALMKLCRPGHENRNFPLAMQEFGLIDNTIAK